MARARALRVLSWNVNGLRANVKKGFLEFLESSEADIVGVQEVRALPAQLPPEAREPAGWHASFSPAERPGYSGVGIYSREAPDRIETSLGDPEIDVERSHLRCGFRHIGQQRDAAVVLPPLEQAHGALEAGANAGADTHRLLDREAVLVLGRDRCGASRPRGRAREKARRKREPTRAAPSVRSDRGYFE
ncbi:MAG: endonuclease/exonuclease/phosphatase family protein [Myxococcales bacterium]|nr:endonuclease/exonuclease/phosphatase family protein [Myxococcales bacterium]